MAILSSAVYVRVRRNAFRVRDTKSGAEKTVTSSAPFTTNRLLIGQFTAAAQVLKDALKQLLSAGLFTPSPSIVIHPLEMTEGGLSEIEERVFREVAIEAGANKVVVWVGHELSDPEVVEKLRPK
jgi:hypothetical protein